MRSQATLLREHTHGGGDALDVVGAGFRTDKDHRDALLGVGERIGGVKTDTAAGGPGGGVESLGHNRVGIRRPEALVQQALDVVHAHPHDGFFAGDHVLGDHIHSELDRG